jgi:hypothetical protein
MGTAEQRVVLTIGDVRYLEQVKAALDETGVLAWIVACQTTREDLQREPGDGMVGSVTARLIVESESLAEAYAVLEALSDKTSNESELPPVETAVDWDAAEATCPGCMARFKTAGGERCPECGLLLQ